MLRTLSLLSVAVVPLLVSASAHAAEEKDFVDFATAHCSAFIEEGRADMSFAMGKASAKFSQAEMLAFNRAFAQKIVAQYGIDPAKGCKLDVVTVKPVVDESNKPKERGRYAQPKAKHEIAVVAGEMGSVDSAAPVSVAYRLERIGVSPWVISNVTLNGQPLVDRYREEYEALAKTGGSGAVLQNL